MTNEREREPLWIPTPDEIAALRRTLEQQDKRIAELEAQLAAERAATNEWKTLANIHGRRMLELEAQLAQTWQPLPDGEVSSFMYIDNGGKLLGVYAGDDYTDWYATDDLPDNIRLCRLAAKGADHE